MKIKNPFHRFIYTFVWIAMIATFSLGAYVVDQENKSSKSDAPWGVVSITNPTVEELFKLVPGDRILLKKRADIDFEKLQWPGPTSMILGQNARIGTIGSYGTEVKVTKVDNNRDFSLPLAIKIPGRKHISWIEPDLIAEITFLVKLKEPRIVRRAYARIHQHTHMPPHQLGKRA